MLEEKKLAILGVGGLGHLGVKFGVAFDNEVVGISRNPDKRDEVLALGAADYIASSDVDQLKSYAGYFEVILSTIDSPGDWNTYINLLKPGGLLILVGIPPEPFTMPVGQLVGQKKIFTGTSIGSPERIEEMLNFCAEKNILPDVQVYPMEEVNKAWDDFRAGKPRYRFVLQIQETNY